MANRFKNPQMQRAYETMLASARGEIDSSLYYPGGTQRRGGSHSAAFWAGFNGVVKSPAAIPGTISWACYVAGRDFAKERGQ